MLALVEAHEKTLGSQQSVDPSCAFIVLMCREDFSITPPGFLSNSGSLSENVASCNPTLDPLVIFGLQAERKRQGPMIPRMERKVLLGSLGLRGEKLGEI